MLKLQAEAVICVDKTLC